MFLRAANLDRKWSRLSLGAMQPQDPEPGSSEHEAETRSNIVVMQDRQSCVQKELRRRPARGETHVLTFSLEGLADHTDAWVVRLCFRVLGDCLMRRIDVLVCLRGFSCF